MHKQINCALHYALSQGTHSCGLRFHYLIKTQRPNSLEAIATYAFTMSGRRESTERFVVGARLLGEELKEKKRRNKV